VAKYAAFLRAVNVGGTGRLPMAELRVLCEDLGFTAVKTYIASGNVVLETGQNAEKIHASLNNAIAQHMGKSVGLFLREPQELRNMIERNPFTAADGNRVMVILLDAEPSTKMISDAKNQVDEAIALGPRSLYVHYPSGMGKSKLKIPGAEQGTARNLNTIRAVWEMTLG